MDKLEIRPLLSEFKCSRFTCSVVECTRAGKHWNSHRVGFSHFRVIAESVYYLRQWSFRLRCTLWCWGRKTTPRSGLAPPSAFQIGLVLKKLRYARPTEFLRVQRFPGTTWFREQVSPWKLCYNQNSIWDRCPSTNISQFFVGCGKATATWYVVTGGLRLWHRPRDSGLRGRFRWAGPSRLQWPRLEAIHVTASKRARSNPLYWWKVSAYGRSANFSKLRWLTLL